MILSLLAVVDEPEYDSVTGNLVPEISIPESLLYALVGFLVTFFGIVLLIFIVWLCGKIVGKLPSLGGKKKAAPAAAVVPGRCGRRRGQRGGARRDRGGDRRLLRERKRRVRISSKTDQKTLIGKRRNNHA